MSAYSPGRPPNLRDLTMGLNGSWTYLGKLVTTGAAAINNATTASPFYYQPKSDADPATGKLANLEGTLAGRTLIVMPVTDALWVAQGESLAAMILNPVTTGSGVNPGLKFSAGERPSFVMSPRAPFLQCVSDGGGVATLHVWELQ